jgi:hypothetical protein
VIFRHRTHTLPAATAEAESDEKAEVARELIALLRQIGVETGQPIFPLPTQQCAHCGGLHLRACPRVRNLQWYRDGAVRAAEYWQTYDDTNVIWPEDLQGVLDE